MKKIVIGVIITLVAVLALYWASTNWNSFVEFGGNVLEAPIHVFTWTMGFLTTSFWRLIQAVVILCAFSILIIVIIWENAKVDGLFVFVERNQIIAIDSGEGNPMRLLANLPDGWIVRGMKIVEGKDNRIGPMRFLEKKYGLYWKGLPPAKVHLFPLIHERINPELKADTPIDLWIIRDPEAKLTRYILFDVPHWFKIPGVEFNDGFRANLLIATHSRTTDVAVAVYDREGKFFPVLDAQLNSIVVNVCGNMGYKNDFIPQDQGPDSEFCNKTVLEVNKQLEELSGLTLYSTYVTRFDTVTTEESDLLRLQKEAEIKLAAAKLLAQADIADVTEAAKALKLEFPDASHEELVKTVRELGVADRIKESGLIAWGAGAGALVDGRSKNENPQKKKQNRRKP